MLLFCRPEIIWLNMSVIIEEESFIFSPGTILISSPTQIQNASVLKLSSHTGHPIILQRRHGYGRLPCERDQGELMNLHDRLWRVCVESSVCEGSVFSFRRINCTFMIMRHLKCRIKNKALSRFIKVSQRLSLI